jgi:hypothetical protein
MEPLELWSDADALPPDQAWWIFGSEEEKIQYRNAGHNPHLTEFLRVTMRRDLIERIYKGGLLCLGVKMAPDLDDSPEILPRLSIRKP